MQDTSITSNIVVNTGDGEMDSGIGLAQAVAALREELADAMGQGAGAQVQFAVGPIDLEFQIEVGREAGASGKIRFWVVEAGAEGKVSSVTTQLVKVHLEPVDAVTGRQVLVAEADSSSSSRPSPATG